MLQPVGAISYKYDGWNVTREMNSDESSTLAEYTYDSSGKPLSMRRNNATYYYTYNARGDVTALVDSNGVVTNSYSYNPRGKHLTSTESVENPYRYASYRYDIETGLYYLQNRYYSPDLMRFITRDSEKDKVGEVDTSNYYHYADGNPINNIDPDGNLFFEIIGAFETIVSIVAEAIVLGVIVSLLINKMGAKKVKSKKGKIKVRLGKKSRPPTLRRGSKGAWVTFLQSISDINWRYRQRGGKIDGDFGPRTEGAVKSFQSSRGIVVDGIVGPITWGMLGWRF